MRYFLSAFVAVLLFHYTQANNIDSLRTTLKNVTGSKKAQTEYLLAEALLETNKTEALNLAVTAESSAIRSQEQTIELQAILLQAEVHSLRQQYPEAQQLLENVISLSNKYKEKEQRSHAYNSLGKIHLRIGELEKARQEFQKSLELRKELKLTLFTSNSYNNLGIVYREMGNLDSARIEFEESYKIAQKANDFKIQAEALNNMAGVYWKEGDFSNAISLYEQSLSLREKTGDLSLIAKSLTNIGIVYKDLSDYENSLNFHQQALRLKREIGQKAGIAYSLNNIGNVFLKLQRSDSAIFYYQQSLEIHDQLGNSIEKANSHNNLALAYKSAKDYQKAIQHLTSSLKIRESIGNQSLISNTVNLLGNLYLEKLEFDKALEQYYLSLKIRKQLQRKDLEAQSLNNIGLLFKSLKNYTKALVYFNQSLEIYTELGNPILLAYQHNVIGGTYWEMNDFGKSLHHYGISLELRKEIGDKRYIASSLKNIGIVHKEAGNTDKAMETYNTAKEIFQSINDSVGVAWTSTYIGNIYKESKQYSRAYNAYQLANRYFTATKNQSGLCAVQYNLGELFIEQNQIQASIKALVKATSLASQIGDKELTLKSSELLSENYQKIGNFKQALKYQSVNFAVKDSIANTEIMKRFADIQINHEIDKKDAEKTQIQKQATIDILHVQKSNTILIGVIAVLALLVTGGVFFFRQKVSTSEKLHALNTTLKRKNEDLKRSEANLSHANMTKAKFFSIIAHDLKNPFSSFIGLTGMLLENFNVMSDEKKQSFIKNLHTSANKTLFLLENLLDWSQTETGHIRVASETFPLCEVVNEVVDLQKSSAMQKDLFMTMQVDETINVRTDKNMLRTVIRNLVSNAIKFTPANGTVSIKASIAEDEVFIHVEDTGAGISEEDKSRIFDKNYDYNKIGKDTAQKGSGLGLLLCKEFIEKQRGKIWVESSEGKGSTFSFSISKAQVLS